MECFVCKKLSISLSTEFIPVLQMSSRDLQLLKRRLHYLNINENSYIYGNICKVHKDKYLKWYTLRQKKCCDPLNKHLNYVRAKSLKTISLEMSMINPEMLIPGKKLCIACYSSVCEEFSTSNMESTSDPDFCESTVAMEQLNKSCELLELSPIKVNRCNSKRKLNYMQEKVSKITKCVSAKAATVLGIETISKPQSSKDVTCPDCISVMEQLLKKFTDACFKEKVQILTLVPDSWTIQQTMTYFNTTQYLVKKARKLKTLGGVLSMPSGRKSVKLSPDVTEKIIDFYYDDSNSRICPGKKDCLSVPTENGRILKQKRLILHNLKDLYIAFKEQHDDLKIGLSKFCSLRPRECVTVGSKGIHSVCVCVYHQNVKLMLHAIHIRDYVSLLKKLVCCIESENCMLHRCDKCPSPEILKKDLMLLDELEISNDIIYKQWVKTDGAELKTVITPVDEFVDDLITKLHALCMHHFFTKTQSHYFRNAKNDLNEDTAIILADFSENYTCIVQDAIQNIHWKKEQVTVHPFLVYVKDTVHDTVKSIPMCVISDHLVHDTTTFWAFQKAVIRHLITNVPQVKYIRYFSDGSSAQYKNYKNFINLCHHENDHGVKAEWHFFASCHGKSACDGIGGTIKRMATKASLQRPFQDGILNAIDLYTFASESIKGIKCFFVTKSEIETAYGQLADRYAVAGTIVGTRTNHSFVPVNENQLLVSRVSGSSTKFLATVGLKNPIAPLTFKSEQYVACVYGTTWWIGKILDYCEELNDYKIMFMHPHGPSSSYTWPKSLDVCWIPYEHIMKAVSTPVTTTGRTYTVAPEEHQAVQLLFLNLRQIKS